MTSASLAMAVNRTASNKDPTKSVKTRIGK